MTARIHHALSCAVLLVTSASALALDNPVTETHSPDLSGTWEIQEADTAQQPP